MANKLMAPHMSLHCNLCGKDVFKNEDDYFMLKDEIWDEVCDNDYVSKTEILCKDCTEYWLGRKLTPEDYLDAPVNSFLRHKDGSVGFDKK